MIQITRNLARQLRAVFRQLEPQGRHAKVSFTTNDQGLVVRLHQARILAEYALPGTLLRDELVLPFEALAGFEGRNEQPVIFEKTGPDNILARWEDCGIPQQRDHAAAGPSKLPIFPGRPESLEENEADLLRALADASRTADRENQNPRYAVNHLQLRGEEGMIVATDGRQLLIQSGCRFPWKEDVLVPASAVFSCKEVTPHAAPSIGKTDVYVALVVGPWTLYLPIGQGRFPQVREVVPAPSSVKAHGWLDAEDCAVLTKILLHLPGGYADNAITVDLNDKVFVRSRANGTGPVTEVLLDRSRHAKQPVRFALDRCYLARALQLGLGEVHVVDADTPILFQDQRRQYVAMPLRKDVAIPPSDNVVRIVSTAAETRQHHQRERNTPMKNHVLGNGVTEADSSPAANGNTDSRAREAPTAGARGGRGHRLKGTGVAALIEEAEVLKKALRDAHGRSYLLLRSLKRFRKQSQIVQTTLRTLKELPGVDG